MTPMVIEVHKKGLENFDLKANQDAIVRAGEATSASRRLVLLGLGHLMSST